MSSRAYYQKTDMSQRSPQPTYYEEGADDYRYQDGYASEGKPHPAGQNEYSDYGYDQDTADDAYSEDEPFESAHQAYPGQVSPGTQYSQDYRSRQAVQKAQARYARSHTPQARITNQLLSTAQAYRQSQPVLTQQQQARQAQRCLHEKSHPALPPQQQSHQQIEQQYYEQQHQLQYQQMQRARQLQQAQHVHQLTGEQTRQEAAQQLQRAQQLQIEKQLQQQIQQAQIQQLQQAQQMKQAEQQKQSQQLQQQAQTQQQMEVLQSARQLQHLLQMRQAQVQQNQQAQRTQQHIQQQYQQQQQAYSQNTSAAKKAQHPVQAAPPARQEASKIKSKDNLTMRPKTVEVRKPCPVEAATSQQYAQLGDWMQHQEQLYVYNSRNRSQLPARYLMDGTYAVMTPTKTSDVAKPSQPSITYPSYAAQSGDTQQKRAGKSIAHATVTPTAIRSPSPHARAASTTRSESTYQQQNTAAVRPLQQYEPRKSPPLAATRQQQQQQQRYASSEHQAAVDGQWAEEVAHQRAYSKANESRYQSPNMNQHLYTSTH